MATPLGQLLSQTWALYQKNLKVIAVGAVAFGLVMGLSQGLMAHRAEQQAKVMMENMGMDSAAMEELSERAANGDEEAMNELLRQMAEGGKKFEGMSEGDLAAFMQGQSLSFLKGLAPTLGISIIVSLVISVLASIYFLLIGLGVSQDPQKLFGMMPGLALPMLGVWIWAVLRSFLWIPFIGIIIAIVLGPRFALAPVIFLTEKTGITGSVSKSYARTQGYWGKIIGNMIVVSILIAIVSIVASMVLGVAAAASTWLMFLLQGIVSQLAAAFSIIFVVKLSQTVLQHPIK